MHNVTVRVHINVTRPLASNCYQEQTVACSLRESRGTANYSDIDHMIDAFAAEALASARAQLRAQEGLDLAQEKETAATGRSRASLLSNDQAAPQAAWEGGPGQTGGPQ